MIGFHERDQGQFFYDFCLDDAVPADHPVRRIAGVLDLSWARGELAGYSDQVIVSVGLPSRAISQSCDTNVMRLCFAQLSGYNESAGSPARKLIV